MSKVICVMGESGSGKTTSCRNLDPTSTYYIDADGKGLSWKGWKSQYSVANKNYVRSTDSKKITKLICAIDKERPDVKVVVVDTINGIMVSDEMRRAQEKGYDKWVDLAQCVWELVDTAYDYRDDLTIVFIAHTQTERDESGFMWTRIKVSGKKLDKIALESKFTTVLLSKCLNEKYVFETRSKNSTTKTPMGAFDTFEIENDIVEVLSALSEY